MADILTKITTPHTTDLLNDTLYVANGAGIFSFSNSVIMAGAARIGIDGALKGYSAISLVDGTVTAGLADTVFVGQTGSLFGNLDAGVAFIDDASLLNNAGVITGTRGVSFDRADTAVAVNSGTIRSFSIAGFDSGNAVLEDSGLGFFACDDVAISNSGLIEGMNAVWLSRSDGALDNSGTIRSTSLTGMAINLDGQHIIGLSMRISNSGDIRASGTAISVLNCAADIINLGLILGDIALGDRNDLLRGSAGTVLGEIFAGDGNDRILSGLGDDTVRGGVGFDLLRGGAGDDMLFGDAGADLIHGGSGDDSLFGGAGADLIEGGGGDDQVTGSSFNDTFQFRRGGGADQVTDFTAGDQLDLTAFGFTAFAQVSALAVDTGAGLFIDLGTRGGGTIRLDGFLKAAFDAADVIL